VPWNAEGGIGGEKKGHLAKGGKKALNGRRNPKRRARKEKKNQNFRIFGGGGGKKKKAGPPAVVLGPEKGGRKKRRVSAPSSWKCGGVKKKGKKGKVQKPPGRGEKSTFFGGCKNKSSAAKWERGNPKHFTALGGGNKKTYPRREDRRVQFISQLGGKKRGTSEPLVWGKGKKRPPSKGEGTKPNSHRIAKQRKKDGKERKKKNKPPKGPNSQSHSKKKGETFRKKPNVFVLFQGEKEGGTRCSAGTEEEKRFKKNGKREKKSRPLSWGWEKKGNPALALPKKRGFTR